MAGELTEQGVAGAGNSGTGGAGAAEGTAGVTPHGSSASPVSPVLRETVVLETVRYDTQTGLVPVVVQDIDTGHVLMLAYANREALKRTLGTGQAWFWSRSRADYWHKGATSGNIQHVVDVRVDCDGDTVLYLVHAAGPACHTGEVSCFYRAVQHGGSTVSEASTGGSGNEHHDGRASATTIGSSSANASSASAMTAIAGGATPTESVGDVPTSLDGTRFSVDDSILGQLWDVLGNRWEERPQGSYTTYLFEQGVDKVAKKVGEEGVEVAIAAKNAVQGDDRLAGQRELASESADLLYHLMALWKTAGISPADVYAVLAKRHGG